MLIKALFTLSLFFFAVIIHEYAHGWVAWKLGDPTAKYAGRLTLNPLAHIDPIGTIFLPLILLMTRSPIIFGWAKPVPIDFLNLENPKRDMVFVGLAGPLANFIFAVFLSLILKFSMLTFNPLFLVVLNSAIVINLVLGIFNLIPIPPLDGSRVLMGILPREMSMQYAKIEPFGFVIIFMLLYLGVIGAIIWPLVMFFSRLLGVSFL